MGIAEREAQARSQERAALRALICDMFDAWGDSVAAGKWGALPTAECTPSKAAEMLAEVMGTTPIVLEPMRLHRIEALARRLWRYIAWRHATGSLSSEEVAGWAKALTAWHARTWSTQDRISA